MKAHRILPFLFITGGFLPFTVHAASDDNLLELINAYRADPPQCEGAQREPLPPLAPDETLAELEIDGGKRLPEAMRAAGYQAARAEALTLSGPSSSQEAMQFAAQQNCRLLLSQRYSMAGVSRQGNTWQIVLAQPLLDPELGDWREAGREVLKLVNAARSNARRCGSERYQPAPALRWNEKLGTAALKHSRDIAEHDYFGHRGSDASTVEGRANQEGYAWRSIGENVAAGQGSPEQVVKGWLSSPGHCANIMNDRFTEMGAAYANDSKSAAIIYWTQVFGKPR
jgi:uncharacterized protein YkwD